jgi:C-terminal processing protease CtpA/Prc
VKLLQTDRLIIDVRGNGGGLIWAGELLLQTLTSQRIEPARFHFINTDATRQLCEASPMFAAWSKSIQQSLQTRENYSQGFPLTPPEMLASVSQQYFGTAVLIIDSLCYSTTDIFAAGFQDHEIGKILGTSRTTGAGGANVVPYTFFSSQLGFATLPKGVSFNTAFRRSTRVRASAGVPLEGFGVEADVVHNLTEKDVRGQNEDLINAAIALFKK